MWNRGIKENNMLPKLEVDNLNVGDLVITEDNAINIVEEEGFMFFKRKVLSLEKRLTSIPMKKFTHRPNCFIVKQTDKEYEFYKSYLI